MLENDGLYFPRADQLGDPFEGSRSHHNDEVLKKVAEMFPQFRQDQENESRIMQWHRGWVFVNCWHANPYESAGMWGLYGKISEAVAVQTTVGRLRELLDDHCVIGSVKYIDYGKDVIPEDKYELYLHKRHSFAHENEMRAIFMNSVIDFAKVNQWVQLDLTTVGPSGVWKPVPFASLVQRVIVAPDSPPFFVELVDKVLQRAG